MAAKFSGTVTDGTSPVKGARVTLIPEPANSELNWLYRTAMADQAGAYSFHGLATGKYRVYAWEELEPNAQMDPDF